jgi:hypothetical protein
VVPVPEKENAVPLTVTLVQPVCLFYRPFQPCRSHLKAEALDFKPVGDDLE